MTEPGNIKLHSKWILWYHHDKKNWKINGYKQIYEINTIKDFWDIHNNLKHIGGINTFHFFLMREGVTPIWEDTNNKKGGCWSIKLTTDITSDIWELIAVLLVGETLSSNSLEINGISICVKSPITSILKIWNKKSSNSSINQLNQKIIDKFGFNIIYRKFSPEY